MNKLIGIVAAVYLLGDPQMSMLEGLSMTADPTPSPASNPQPALEQSRAGFLSIVPAGSPCRLAGFQVTFR